MPDARRNTAQDKITALSDLITDIVDVIRGYDTVKERAKHDLRTVAEDLLDLHIRHAAELMEHLEAMGGRPENTGSMMGAVHTAIATARDWFGVLDGSALDQVVNGEERLIDSYVTALGVIETDNALGHLLHTQKEAVRLCIIDLRAGD